MVTQRPKNDPYSPYFNPRWRNHPSMSWDSGPNVVVHNSQPGTFYGNNFQPSAQPPQSFPRPIFSGAPNAPRPPLPVAQMQPPPSYTELDKFEWRINNNIERMINANNAHMERMMRMITELFSQLASSSREPGTFPSQPEVNPKGHTPSPSSGINESVRKVNAVISLRSGREIDNQVRNPDEPCRYPHQFFQNSSPSSAQETGSSNGPGDTPDSVPNASKSPSSSPPSEEEELQEKDSSDSARD